MSARRTKIITKHFAKAKKMEEENDFIKFAMDEENNNHWYVLFHNFPGDDDEYVGGQFIFKIILGDEYPLSPPDFKAITPNGLYSNEGNLCIHIGKYHKDQYKATLGAGLFAMNVYSGLIGWKTIGSGIGLQKTSVSEKKKISADSKAWNENNAANILQKFDFN